MQILALKTEIDFTEDSVDKLETAYLVNPGETVEELFVRVGLTGEIKWHYSNSKITLKLIRDKC